MKLASYISLIRVTHWVKNVFVLAPVFFAGLFIENGLEASYGVIAFCLMASTVYVLNDILDIKHDAGNSDKFNVFEQGLMSKGSGLTLGALLALTAQLVLMLVGFKGWYWLSLYLVLNIIYSLGAKNIPYLEMLFVVSGFLLRILLGASISDVPISVWLYIEVLAFTSLIIIGRRWKELKIYVNTGVAVRPAITMYNRPILRGLFIFFELALFATYIMYSLDPSIQQRLGWVVIYTIPFVLIGLIRFSWVIFKREGSGNPVRILFKDPWLMLTIFAWVTTWLIVMYV